jgi:hypothetical protein
MVVDSLFLVVSWFLFVAFSYFTGVFAYVSSFDLHLEGRIAKTIVYTAN